MKNITVIIISSLIALFILSYGLFSMTLDTESSPIINYICIGGGFFFCMTIAIFVVKEGLHNQKTPK